MGHGLTFPGDLDAWGRWHASRHRTRSLARRARQRLRPSGPTRVDLLTPGADADVLVAVEATHASVQRAVVSPMALLAPARTSVVCPPGWVPPMEFAAHGRRTIELDDLEGVIAPRVVLAAGHYTEIGAAAHALAQRHELPFLVAQHGALTPFAPPLPPDAHLLAWTEQDATFWSAGRNDVTVTTTGSQLLWGAGAGLDSARPTGGGPLLYLGQGHAAEIPRARMVEAALLFCREHDARYRPHPSERDRISLMTLNAYQRAGITVDTAAVPLAEISNPVVSVFSTGVLEAAARGRDAWVDFPSPPAWLGEFWERYSMSRYGSDPTPAPVRPAVEPAQRIAEIVMEAAR